MARPVSRRTPARLSSDGAAPVAGQIARRTKIVATIGPASRPVPVLRRLIAAGMNVARLNFSHGTRDEHGRTMRDLRRLAREAGVPLAVLQDLQGPKIRVGRLAEPLKLQEGVEVTLVVRAAAPPGRIPVPFPGLPRAVRTGSRILLRDGTMELVVLRTSRREIRCRVVRGGTLGAHQGVNIPGMRLAARSLTTKDAADLRYGLRLGVDYVALSFVRRAEDLRHARRVMRRFGRSVPLVAKLEKAEAVGHLNEIVAEADAVMVARGDLGVELSPEEVPLIQKRIIRAANERGIPVITATQMLESMVRQERPTRAETSDVANAILDGTDAVMLSEETAAGRYPVESVQEMDRIARAAEPAVRLRLNAGRTYGADAAHAIASAAGTLASRLGVSLILAVTATGRTGRLLSQIRAPVPVLAWTDDAGVARLLNLYWGVHALVTPFQPYTEDMMRFLDREVLSKRLARARARVVVVGSMPIVSRGRTNFLQIHRLGTTIGARARRPRR